MTAFERLFERLEARDCRPRRLGDSRCSARCPAHEDSTPSLYVDEGTTQPVVVRCFAGCDTSAILSALDLSWDDISKEKPQEPPAKRIVASYPYRDEAGTLLYEVVRYEPKGFAQRRPTGPNSYSWSVKDVRRVLYRLPELRAAIAAGETVYVCEGEKDADALARAGVCATTNSGGASPGRFSPDLVDQLDGAKRIVIVADADAVGREHARSVASLLTLKSIPHELREPARGKDVAELLAAGGTLEDLVELRDDSDTERDAAEATVVALPGDSENPLIAALVDWREFWDTDFLEEDWLVEGFVPAGRSIAVYAEAKTGKSFVLLGIAAGAATGRGFCSHPPGEPVSVLYCDFEMTTSDLSQRLASLGYSRDDDLSALSYSLLPAVDPLDTEAGGRQLLEAAIAVDARIVIVDTMSRAVAGGENDADTIRSFYRYSGLLLKQHGISFIRSAHSGKDPSKGMRGSSSARDDVDIVVRLERTDSGVCWNATHRRISWYPERTQIAVSEDDSGVQRFSLIDEAYPSGTFEMIRKLDEAGIDPDTPIRRVRALGISGGTDRISAAQRARRQRQSSAEISQLVPKRPSTLDAAAFFVSGDSL